MRIDQRSHRGFHCGLRPLCSDRISLTVHDNELFIAAEISTQDFGVISAPPAELGGKRCAIDDAVD